MGVLLVVSGLVVDISVEASLSTMRMVTWEGKNKRRHLYSVFT